LKALDTHAESPERLVIDNLMHFTTALGRVPV
jgi:hypothetical protein